MGRFGTQPLATDVGGSGCGDTGDGDESGGHGGRPDGSKPPLLIVLGAAKADGRSILTDLQYAYVVEIVQRLVEFGDREATADLRISRFGKFWALKLKGGFLKRLNLRIYFAYVKERNEIVVLMTYKKEEDRRVSPHVKVTLEDRLEGYLNGERQRITVYRRRGA